MSHSLTKNIFPVKKQTVKSIKKEPYIQNFLTMIFEYKEYKKKIDYKKINSLTNIRIVLLHTLYKNSIKLIV